MAGPIDRQQDFNTSDTVTSTKLNNIVDNALFKGTDGNGVSFTASTGGDLGTCVAAGGLEVHSAGQLQIKDSGVITAKIADSSSKTTGVTFAKMQHISTAKVLGRASASEGDVEEAFDFKDEDNMSSNSATALASQQSVKAYVDASSTDGFTPTTMAGSTKSVTFPNGLIFKFGTVTGLSSEGETTIDLSSVAGGDFPNACLNASATAINSDGGTGSDNDYWMQVKSISTSEIVYILQGSSSPESSGPGFHWQAFGH